MRGKLAKLLLWTWLRTLFTLRSFAMSHVTVITFPEFAYGGGYLLPKLLKASGIRLIPFSRPALLQQYDPLWIRLFRRLRRNQQHLLILVCFEDNTVQQVDVRSYLCGLDYETLPLYCLNIACHDISKDKVASEFEKVFGYEIAVDPATYTDKIVVKSDLNGLHDGRVVQGPIIDPHQYPGAVFQRLVDNRVSDNLVEDLRCAVVGGEIALVYSKQRPIDDRFSNINLHVSLVPLSNALSPSEQQSVRQFAKAIGLDFGELDLLRDRNSGLIYVVDVNKTVAGPPNHLPLKDAMRAILRLSQSFTRQVVKNSHQFQSKACSKPHDAQIRNAPPV